MAANFFKAAIFLGILLHVANSSPAASTLCLDQKQTTFSLNVANDSNDIYFHFESPAQHAWVAVGAGTEMKGALMFFMYPSKDNQHVTFSPRIATGVVEPTYTEEIQVDIYNGSSTQNGKLVLNAVCHNCRSWNGGSLNISSTAQPWMHAFGPTSNPVSSDSMTAGLTQHATYGKFTMDMTQATGPGGVPAASSISSGITLTGNQYIKDGDELSVTHGYAMAALVLVFTPILILHLLSGARLRWINYTVFILVAVLGLVCGFYDSMTYNRSKNFGAPHQIIAYVVIIGLLVLPKYRMVSRMVSRHRHRPKTPQPDDRSGWISRIGIWIGMITWILALVDGFLGIKLADSKNYIYVIYGCCIIAMIVVAGPLIWFVKKRHDRREKREDPNGAGIIPTS